jgi:hypothetical protein
MKTSLFMALAISMAPVAALACGPFFGPKQAGYSSVGIELNEFATTDAVVEFYTPIEEGEAKPNVVLSKDAKRKFDYILLITRDNLQDDSLSSMQTRIGLNKTGETWVVRSVGERWKCARTKTPDKWTTKLCP